MFWMFSELLYFSPLESFCVLAWLSYNFPDSVFRRLFVKMGSILAFLVAVFVFLLVYKNLEHFIPGGVPINSVDGLYVDDLYISSVETDINQDYGYVNYYFGSGYDLSITVHNNTDRNIKELHVTINQYECMTKPNKPYGNAVPDDCVDDDRREFLDYNPIIEAHSSKTLLYKTNMEQTTQSAGKYPYIFNQTSISGYSVHHNYDGDPAQSGRVIPEYMR